MTIPITYTPMTGPLLLWRCLHGGPLSPGNIDRPSPDGRVAWEALRARNLPLLEALTRAYGACAMVAGVRFWERLGYRVVKTEAEPAFQGGLSEEMAGFLGTMRREAEELGIDPGTITQRHTMRLELE